MHFLDNHIFTEYNLYILAKDHHNKLYFSVWNNTTWFTSAWAIITITVSQSFNGQYENVKVPGVARGWRSRLHPGIRKTLIPPVLMTR